MRYSLLLRIDVEHAYWGDARAPVSIVPSATTARALGQHDCLVKTGPAELVVAIAEPLSDPDDEPASPETLDLVFVVVADDVTATAMTIDGGVGIAVADLTDSSEDTVVLSDPVPQPMFTRQPVDCGLSAVDFDLRPLAVLGLTLSTDDREVRRRVRIEAPEVHWIYSIVGSDSEQFYSISGPKGAMTFAPIDERVLANGRRALRFRSEGAIPIRAKCPERFRLISTGTRGELTLVDPLPHPRASALLGKDPETEIFVTLQ